MWIVPISVALSAMGAVNGDFLSNSRSGQYLAVNTVPLVCISDYKHMTQIIKGPFLIVLL